MEASYMLKNLLVIPASVYGKDWFMFRTFLRRRIVSTKSVGILLAVTAAGFLMSGYVLAEDSHTTSPATAKCSGVNSCKGVSECKSATNACKGQNSCKGKGWVHMKDAKTCEDAKGQVVKEDHDHDHSS
jgi:hypothetical protein